MTLDLSIIFDIPESQYFAALRCHVAFAFKIRNHRALRCKQRCVASKANVAFAFKIRNHRALRCFLYLSLFSNYHDASAIFVVVSVKPTIVPIWEKFRK